MQDYKNNLFRIAKNLKKLRISNNYTQEYICEQLNIDRRGLQRIENPKTCPDIRYSTLKKFLVFYECTLNDLEK